MVSYFKSHVRRAAVTSITVPNFLAYTAVKRGCVKFVSKCDLVEQKINELRRVCK